MSKEFVTMKASDPRYDHYKRTLTDAGWIETTPEPIGDEPRSDGAELERRPGKQVGYWDKQQTEPEHRKNGKPVECPAAGAGGGERHQGPEKPRLG